LNSVFKQYKVATNEILKYVTLVIVKSDEQGDERNENSDELRQSDDKQATKEKWQKATRRTNARFYSSEL